ncbi:MAG: Mov34/MPN/PAD-1 family protein [Oscillospiraceae bacterium]|nr:Mov34/MPN/PAD-1 family protein [Oscillospiraceae bacterium]
MSNLRKKGSKKKKAVSRELLPELPQNIFPVGERVLDNKNIYIHQKVYAQIHKFASNKTENEHGGILVGRVVNEMGKENTIIEAFIEAKYNAATPTTLTFTHETWEHFHSEMDKKYKDRKIVGWIHTHPNFGIFLSENDRFIQQNFFTDVNQVAYVVDPIQNDEGFFFWVDGRLERCPGFYLFDKVGIKIRQKAIWEKGSDDENEGGEKSFGTGILIPILLALIVLANMVLTINQNSRMNRLAQKLAQAEQVIQSQIIMINGLREQVYELEGYHMPEPQEETTENTEKDSEKK